MKWLSWQDDELPDWAHTAAILVIAGAFAVPWWWIGVAALISGQLPPVMGPDFGTWVFGQETLSGSAARLGGLCLVTWGLDIMAWGLAGSRWAAERRALHWLPWGLLALTGLMMVRVHQLH